MSAQQSTAFVQATGGIVASPYALSYLIASILAVMALLWLSWIAYAQLRAWRTGKADFYDFLYSTVRAAAVVMLISFFIHP